MKLHSMLNSPARESSIDTQLVVRIIIGFVVAVWITYRLVYTYIDYKKDILYGFKHGCQSPPEIQNRWPLGIDRIKQLLEADKSQKFLEFISRFMDQYPGGLCSQNFLMGPRGYNSLIPKNVETILSSSFSDYSFGVRASVLGPLMGEGIFTQEGPAWKHSRQMLRSQFVRAQYHTLSQFDEHIDNLLARLPDNGEVDLQPLFFDFTLDTSSALLLGRSVYSLRNADEASRSFAAAFAVAQDGVYKQMRIPAFRFLYYGQKLRNACSIVHSFIDGYIQSVRQQPTTMGKTDSYGIIAQMMLEGASDKTIRDQILNILVAGRDTTACCLSWTFRLLARHPEVLEKLREEINAVIGESKRPARAEVKQMPYLAKVVKETLRLYPPVPVNIREAKITTILPVGGGVDGLSPVLVRKGEVVTFSQYATARRKNIFGEDAAKYRPERWDNPTRTMNEAFFAFNLGPRRCLGEEFALLEIYYVIIAMLQTFPDISIASSEMGRPLGSEKQNLSLVLSCAEGCEIRLNKTSSSSKPGKSM